MVSLKICKMDAGLNRLDELKGRTPYAFYDVDKWHMYEPTQHTLNIRLVIRDPRHLMYHYLRTIMKGWTGLNRGMVRSHVTGPQIRGSHTNIDVSYNVTTMNYLFIMRWHDREKGMIEITEKLTEREMQEQVHEQRRS